MNLTISEVIEIDRILDSIGCKTDTIRSHFKERYAELKSEEERKLILDLSKRFTYIPLSAYPHHLEIAINKFFDSYKSSKSIIVMNGFASRDYLKIKSNYLISYQFKGLFITKNVKWNKNIPNIVDNIKALLQYKNPASNELILVDDFIGSGETIETAYNYIYNRLKAHGKKMPHVSVICLAVMQDAVNLLSKMNLNVYSSVVLKRGISDYYKGENLDKAKEIMTNIEQQFNVKDAFRFGYHNSEALICMERCPNNTFPFFWKPYKKINAPFRR